MQRVQQSKGFEKVLKQCQETIERFEGSPETLGYIRRVEESLRNLIAETD